jgi:hypothetical protein
MKEQLYTIPLNDAIAAEDECPFCFIERKVEQDLLDFVLGSGSSYMESHIRSNTDSFGFCRTHFKKMYDYGNTLGNGWILKTHYQTMITEMKSQFKSFQPNKTSWKNKLIASSKKQSPIGIWAEEKTKSCYLCKEFETTYQRYLDTFFIMYQRDPAFREKLLKSKGFCLPHFGDICEAAEQKLSEKEKIDFYPLMFHLMEENMNRLSEDVSWLVDKFDYRNKDADWKNSKDAIQRGMQKLKGGYPGDSPYKMTK